MVLFRLEHKQTKDGMWTVQLEGKPIVDHLSDDRLSLMPMPHHERYRFENKIWRCSVADMESMHQWFSAKDMKEMIDFDFRMVRFESNEFIIEPHQILFNCASRENETDITQDFLKGCL